MLLEFLLTQLFNGHLFGVRRSKVVHSEWLSVELTHCNVHVSSNIKLSTIKAHFLYI
jgi:hypothetical protein